MLDKCNQVTLDGNVIGPINIHNTHGISRRPSRVQGRKMFSSWLMAYMPLTTE